MNDWELEIDEIREIRKHQALLDPRWSADRENAMIGAGGKVAQKKLVEYLNERTIDFQADGERYAWIIHCDKRKLCKALGVK